MNIIQLFSLLDLKNDQILEFSSEDYIRIEKKINFEKKVNPELDSNTSENLIIALKDYKEELLFVMSNLVLFNFLNHNNVSKNNVSNYNLTVSDEKIKEFIALFLTDDLISFFSLKLSKNSYNDLEELDAVLDLKRYFPEDIIYKMGLLLYSKLDFAISQLNVSTTNEFSNIAYIRHSAFYDLLSHFATIELDQKMVVLLNLVADNYEKMTNIVFFSSVIKSMASYNAFLEGISKLLIEGREILMRPKEKKGDENDELFLVIKIISVIVFLLIAFHKLGYY
ncbi:hypothetical protein B0A79_21390 [Flavobacterium piscis]|uniref:hypothetical protein n=1 Tax=Flavobacterium piscis TaxID=1114874 RepID=UPI000B79D4B0|nr:hypothetical protein [Flavobacterium piscis]OXE97631.1 hypothetical protein B0A79_21390 [Flavobacterium piscis]